MKNNPPLAHITLSQPNRMGWRKVLARGMLGIATIWLTGCAERSYNDLTAEVERIKKLPSPPPQELPPFKPDIPHLYTVMNMRDPFQDLDRMQGTEKGNVENTAKEDASLCMRPDAHRNKEALENFPLDALTMVGILEQGKRRWGLVLDPDQVIYQVEVNNYIGQNHGKIINITETAIELVEMVDDGRGCYVERASTLASEAKE